MNIAIFSLWNTLVGNFQMYEKNRVNSSVVPCLADGGTMTCHISPGYFLFQSVAVPPPFTLDVFYLFVLPDDCIQNYFILFVSMFQQFCGLQRVQSFSDWNCFFWIYFTPLAARWSQVNNFASKSDLRRCNGSVGKWHWCLPLEDKYPHPTWRTCISRDYNKDNACDIWKELDDSTCNWISFDHFHC